MPWTSISLMMIKNAVIVHLRLLNWFVVKRPMAMEQRIILNMTKVLMLIVRRGRKLVRQSSRLINVWKSYGTYKSVVLMAFNRIARQKPGI